MTMQGKKKREKEKIECANTVELISCIVHGLRNDKGRPTMLYLVSRTYHPKADVAVGVNSRSFRPSAGRLRVALMTVAGVARWVMGVMGVDERDENGGMVEVCG